MAWVAEVLATRTVNTRVAQHLRRLAREIRPGLPPHVSLDPGVASVPLPPQWREYQRAWATARAVILRVAPLQRDGSLDGLGLAVEPWPLLETLLHRSVRAAAIAGQSGGLALHAHEQTLSPFLKVHEPTTGPWAPVHTDRQVEPDASLTLDGRVLATFEAKYSVPSYHRTRTHFFQATATAAAVGAPVAVLVYPEAAPTVRWDVQGFDGKPATVLAVGLDMYGYRRGPGDEARGKAILAAIATAMTSLEPPSRPSLSFDFSAFERFVVDVETPGHVSGDGSQQNLRTQLAAASTSADRRRP